MYAEAENEINGGPSADAYNAINMVRRRGFGQSINTPNVTVDIPSGLNSDDFFKAIMKERSLEFGGEGLRKYDLIRWNKLAAKLDEAKATLNTLGDRTGIFATVPSSMYAIIGAKGDDYTIWTNSYYAKQPSAQPANTLKISWAGTGVKGIALNLAKGFKTGKSELLPISQSIRDVNPNLTQNPGY